MNKLNVLILYLMQVLFADVNSQILFEGDECYLKNTTKIGECRLEIDCPSFMTMAENEVGLRNTIYHFTSCGFSGMNQIVCCPEPSNETSEITQTPPTTVKVMSETPSVILNVTVRTTIDTSTNPLRKSIRHCQIYSEMIGSLNIIPLSPHIINGKLVQANEFPHMAALGYSQDNKIEYNCGGSLISDRYVLTAGHCVNKTQFGEPILLKMRTFDIEDSGVVRGVESTIAHPLYKANRKYNDIALIRLNASVEFDGFMHPACLYTSMENPTTQITAIGYGKIEFNRNVKSRYLLKASFEVVNPTECITEYSKIQDSKSLPNGIDTRSQICITNRNVNNSDTCQGDSGGPLQIKNDNDKLYSIVGITSFGRGCGTLAPSVDTRVSNYLDWIESIVWP